MSPNKFKPILNQQFFIILIDYQQNSSNAIWHHFDKVVVVFCGHFRQLIFI